MKKKRLLTLGILFTIFYCYGVVSFRYNLQPIPMIRYILHRTINVKSGVDNEIFYKNFIGVEKKKIHNTFNVSELLKKRENIIKNYILDSTQVKINQTDFTSSCFGEVKQINSNFYGINQKGFLKQNNSKKLLVFIQGHFMGNPCEQEDLVDLYDKFSNDYDFLILSMFNMGLNSQRKISFPIKITSSDPMEYSNQNFSNYRDHSIIRYFYDSNFPNKKPLSLFLSSQYYTIKSLLKNYDEVVLSGLSGGGWYTSLLGGLIPQIKKTFSFNGSLPLIYRISTNSMGDFEQQGSSLWGNYDYYDFYFLSLIDDNGNINRETHLIFSEFDTCCFSSPENIYFEKSMNEMEIKGLEVKIFKERNKHEVEVDWFYNKLNQID